MSWLAVQCASSPVEGVSFATDLFLSHEAVRKRVAVSVKAYEEIIYFIKARAEVEESYAEGLQKVAALPLSTHSDSTMHEAIEAIRSNLLNKATQHSLLSEQLRSSELLEEIKSQQTKSLEQQKALTLHLANFNKEIKTLEDKYRSSSRKYAKAWHESCLRCGDCLSTSPYPASKTNRSRRNSSSFSPSRQSSSSISPARSSTASPSSSPVRTSRKSSSPPPPLQLSKDDSTNSTSSGKEKNVGISGVSKPIKSGGGGTNIAQWLMPTEEERRTQATHVFEVSTTSLEEARMATSNAWKMLVGAQQRCCLGLQSELSQVQLCEEEGACCLRDLIRSNLVHESSLIANTVYDMETSTAPKVNGYDPLLDLSRFVDQVRSNCSIHNSMDAVLTSRTSSMEHQQEGGEDRDSVESFVSACSSQERRGSESVHDLETVKEMLNTDEEEDEVLVDKPTTLTDGEEDFVEEKMKSIRAIHHTCGGSSVNVPLLTRPGAVVPKPPVSIDRSGLMFPPPCKAVVPTTAQYRAYHREKELIPRPSVHPWSPTQWHLPIVVATAPVDGTDDTSITNQTQRPLIPALKMLNLIASFQPTFDFQDSETNQENKISGSADLDELHHGGSGGGKAGHSITYLADGSKVKAVSLPVHNHMFFGSLYRKNGVIAPSARSTKGLQTWRSLTGIRVIDTAAESFGNKMATTAFSAFSGPNSSSPSSTDSHTSNEQPPFDSNSTATNSNNKAPEQNKWVDIDKQMVEASISEDDEAQFTDGYQGRDSE